AANKCNHPPRPCAAAPSHALIHTTVHRPPPAAAFWSPIPPSLAPSPTSDPRHSHFLPEPAATCSLRRKIHPPGTKQSTSPRCAHHAAAHSTPPAHSPGRTIPAARAPSRAPAPRPAHRLRAPAAPSSASHLHADNRMFSCPHHRSFYPAPTNHLFRLALYTS